MAVLHRVAAMVADAGPHDDPVGVDHYRNGSYDMLIALSGGSFHRSDPPGTGTAYVQAPLSS